MNFYGDLKANAKDVSIPILLRNKTTNAELTGVVAADIISCYYWRQGGSPTAIPIHNLSDIASNHSDGGWKPNVSQAGLNRLDIPDAASEEGVDWVIISVITANSFAFNERFNIQKESEIVTSEIFLDDAGILNISYITVAGADEYFDARLNSDSWTNASTTDKEKALKQASRAISRLNFMGSKYDSDQVLEFPRGTNTTIPDEIKMACCEEALSLLDGTDLQMEQSTLGVLSEGFSSVRVTYDRTVIQENVLSGIVSIVAWQYLHPFLRDSLSFDLSRAN